MAARVRTLADAVADLRSDLERHAGRFAGLRVAELDGGTRQALLNVAAAISLFTRELGTTNRHLAGLVSRPLMGMLGGGAETEVNRLVKHLDDLRRTLDAEAERIAGR